MLQSQSELIQRLTLQLRSMEEAFKASQDECNNLREQVGQATVNLNESQAELNQVLLSLEELALSYDSKDKEVQKTISAKLMLQEEVERLKVGGWVWLGDGVRVQELTVGRWSREVGGGGPGRWEDVVQGGGRRREHRAVKIASCQVSVQTK